METGYDWFNPGRYYDYWSGRWLQVDPLADKYPGWSPYNYAMNNPITVIDYDGWDTIYVAELPEISVQASEPSSWGDFLLDRYRFIAYGMESEYLYDYTDGTMTKSRVKPAETLIYGITPGGLVNGFSPAGGLITSQTWKLIKPRFVNRNFLLIQQTAN